MPPRRPSRRSFPRAVIVERPYFLPFGIRECLFSRTKEYYFCLLNFCLLNLCLLNLYLLTFYLLFFSNFLFGNFLFAKILFAKVNSILKFRCPDNWFVLKFACLWVGSYLLMIVSLLFLVFSLPAVVSLYERAHCPGIAP